MLLEATQENASTRSRNVIAALAVIAIILHLLFDKIGLTTGPAGIAWAQWPLLVAIVCSLPLLLTLVQSMLRMQFGADLLAGISIVTSVILGQYLAGTLVVLMLAGGQALESYAVRRASSALGALARRLPAIAHRKVSDAIADIPLGDVVVGDTLVVFPHEMCVADGTVLDGRSTMNEAYLTGEPFMIAKVPGAGVLSGAINGEGALQIRVERVGADSRYGRIMHVMRESEQHRPRMRRLGDQIGAIYTPVVVIIALAAWFLSGDVMRFLSVLVVATPCPLLIAIPVAIIGAVSVAARRAIIIKDPASLEMIDQCTVAIFDKTGTLTYGDPQLVDIVVPAGFVANEVLPLVASLELYSRHPLAAAIVRRATELDLPLLETASMSEAPGQGLAGVVDGKQVQVTSRTKFLSEHPEQSESVPPMLGGLECVVLIGGKFAALLRFRDAPRSDGAEFVRHLGPRHQFKRVLLVSGDRASEVEYLAKAVGITEVYAGQSPEQKLALVREETSRARTLFMGDGINDAPALTAATVGIAFGHASDVTTEAAGIVILDSSLERVDEVLHLGRRMRRVALQSAVGGMLASLVAVFV
ncbi:MAG: heavy metal translocating P-type ATPase, partial [Gemmatimonadaceae bacterium]